MTSVCVSDAMVSVWLGRQMTGGLDSRASAQVLPDCHKCFLRFLQVSSRVPRTPSFRLPTFLALLVHRSSPGTLSVRGFLSASAILYIWLATCESLRFTGVSKKNMLLKVWTARFWYNSFYFHLNYRHTDHCETTKKGHHKLTIVKPQRKDFKDSIRSGKSHRSGMKLSRLIHRWKSAGQLVKRAKITG